MSQRVGRVCAHARWCLTLCDPVDYRVPGSSVHGIFQARILKWVAISYSKGSSWPRDLTRVSCISCTAGRFFTTVSPEEHGQGIYNIYILYIYIIHLWASQPSLPLPPLSSSLLLLLQFIEYLLWAPLFAKTFTFFILLDSYHCSMSSYECNFLLAEALNNSPRVAKVVRGSFLGSTGISVLWLKITDGGTVSRTLTHRQARI